MTRVELCKRISVGSLASIGHLSKDILIVSTLMMTRAVPGSTAGTARTCTSSHYNMTSIYTCIYVM